MDAMALLQDKDLSAYTIDVHIKATLKGGLSTPLDFKDISLQKLLENSKYEKV
jgi:hypothetical protein